MVRRWISEAQRTPKATPGFVPVNLAAVRPQSRNTSVSDKRSIICIEIPRADEAFVVEWPVEHAHGRAALPRDLLG